MDKIILLLKMIVMIIDYCFISFVTQTLLLFRLILFIYLFSFIYLHKYYFTLYIEVYKEIER